MMFVCNDTVKETVVRIVHLFSYRWHVLLAVSGLFTAAEEGLELIKVCCRAETVPCQRTIKNLGDDSGAEKVI